MIFCSRGEVGNIPAVSISTSRGSSRFCLQLRLLFWTFLFSLYLHFLHLFSCTCCSISRKPPMIPCTPLTPSPFILIVSRMKNEPFYCSSSQKVKVSEYCDIFLILTTKSHSHNIPIGLFVVCLMVTLMGQHNLWSECLSRY